MDEQRRKELRMAAIVAALQSFLDEFELCVVKAEWPPGRGGPRLTVGSRPAHKQDPN